MKLFFLSLLLMIYLTSLASAETIPMKDLPKLGDRIQAGETHSQILVSSAQAYPDIEIKTGGIVYTIAISQPTNDVKYISTKDPLFKTYGLSIGSTIKDALLIDKSPICERGWGCSFKLPSGWFAAVYTDDALPPEDTKLQFFFQK